MQIVSVLPSDWKTPVSGSPLGAMLTNGNLVYSEEGWIAVVLQAEEERSHMHKLWNFL